MTPRLLKATALALFLPSAATTALAHAQLQQAVPPVGGTVDVSPKQLILRFSEGVEPRFSAVALSTEAGSAIVVGRTSVDPSDATVLIVKIGQALKPGVYFVTWHVVSVDTHKTQGGFRFTVAP